MMVAVGIGALLCGGILGGAARRLIVSRGHQGQLAGNVSDVNKSIPRKLCLLLRNLCGVFGSRMGTGASKAPEIGVQVNPRVEYAGTLAKQEGTTVIKHLPILG